MIVLSSPSFLRQQQEEPASDVVMGPNAEVLAELFHPGVAASMWRRFLPTELARWLGGLTTAQLPKLRTEVPLHLVEAAVISACEKRDLGSSEMRDLFTQDIAALALVIGKLFDVRRVQLRLDVSTGVMCPKFHLDQVRARLLCTYRGAGTEYVAENHVEDPVRHRQMETGVVGLFRGAGFESDQPCRLLHRSPPQRATEGARLLLVMEPAE